MATAHKSVTTRGGSGKVVKRTLPPWVYPSELPGDTGDTTGTIAQMTLPATNGRIPVVYGRQRLGGDIFALVQDAVTRRLVAGIGLCEGEIEQVESFTMDDGTDPSYFGSYTSYTGTLTQSADTVLTTALLSTVGKLEKYPGLAYLVFEYLTTAPEIRWPRPIVKGRKIYDPRENRIINSETFSSPTWTCSGTFPTHASGIADRPGYTNASRWTFGGSGPYTMSRQTSGLGLGTGDAVTVTLEMRCAAGATVTLTAAKSVGGASASTSCTVTSTWKQFEVTLAAGSGTGEGKIQVSGIASSTVLEVAFASVQKTSENYGYVKTTASAVTAQTAYSANPALEMLDLKSNQDFGQGVPTASIDLASVGRAAAYCDEVVDHGEKRWECHITIREPAAAEEWFKTIGIHFGGFWRFKSGKWNLYYGHPDPVVAMSITTSHIVGSPKCRRGTTAGLLDAPNRVTTRWIDAAGGTWDEIPVYVQTSDVETAGTEVREFSPQTPGYQLKTQAERCANRLLNRVLADLMCSVDITLDGAALAPGDRVQVTDDSVGLSAQDFLVVNMRRNDDAGTITLELEEYDEAIWTGTAGATDTAPTVPDQSPFDTPGVVGIATVTGGGAFDPRIFWRDPVTYEADVQYGASFWSSNLLTSFTAANVNDGNTSTTAFVFGSSLASYLKFDAGSGNTKRFGKCRIYASNASQIAPIVAYSDDDSTYTVVAPDGSQAYSSSWLDSFSACDFKTDGSTYVELDWDDVGAHRYWRIQKSDTGATYTVREVQFSVIENIFPSQWIDRYEVYQGSSTSGPMIYTRPGRSAPTVTDYVDLSPWVTQTPGTGLTSWVMHFTVAVRNVMGGLSAGRTIYRITNATYVSGSSTSASTVSPYIMQRTATGGAVQTAHADISGTFRSGKLGKSGAAGEFVLPAADGSANQLLKTDGAGNLGFTSNAPTASDGVTSASGTAPLTLNLAAKALTGSIAITPTNSGGGVALQASTPGTAQTGNANLSGKVKAGQLEADPQAAGTIALEVDNVASPTVALATFRLNDVEQSKIDKKGSLQTLESSRIAPWVETMVVATATTINSTTAADLNGLTVTFTPPSDCRAMIVAVLDAKMTTTGSGFLGELVVNGTPDTNQIIFNPQTNNERVPITGVWTVALTGGTSYTIKMQGKLNGGAGVFSIAAGSRFSFVAVGKF